MLTAIQLCSQALVLIGAQPITALNTSSTESTVASQLYEGVVQDMLTRHRWRFATRQRVLTVTTPAAGDMEDDRWSGFYEVPADCLLIQALTVNGYPIDFDRQQNLILTNAVATDEVVLTYNYRAPENTWPPYFDSAVRLQLASVFAMAVANREGLRTDLEQAALRAMASARQQDSQGRTNPRFDVSRMVNARRTVRDRVQ